MVPESYVVQKPQDWDKALAAAFFWQIAGELKATAKAVGISESTMQRWVRSPWWGRACAESRPDWFSHLTAESRRTVVKAIQEGDSDLALRILERTDPQLAPPAQRLEVRASVQQLIASLPADEVRRLRALPEDERKEELQRLLGPGGIDG